jgi:NADH-quinone oxidoreductase subunit H
MVTGSNPVSLAPYNVYANMQQDISLYQIIYKICYFVTFKFLQLCCIVISEIIPLLLAIAVITLIERRAMGSIQRRRGPNETGDLGMLQPIADGIKLIIKELFTTSNSNAGLFMAAPIYTLFFTLFFWSLIPGAQRFAIVELQYVLLVFLIVGTFNVQTVIMAGWASNSKYAFLGGIRAASQMISYEICMGTVIGSVMLTAGSYSLCDTVYNQWDIWFVIPLFPTWVLFVIIMPAETNRTPFDSVEAEAESVAGYNVEYSSVLSAMPLIAEYGNILIMSTVSTLFFYGGWLPPFCGTLEEAVHISNSKWVLCGVVFAAKIALNVFIFVLVRATVPRYRYDQLMNIGWKTLLPISVTWLLLQSALMLCLEIVS